jgi:prepilin-type N-terminal cleavage/methylation domain-containing protein
MFSNNKAFTLIELMVVIVIIGILATLAIPKFNEASVKAKVSEAPTVLSSYDNAQLAYLAETNLIGDVSSLALSNPTTISSKYYTYTHSFNTSSSGKLNAQAAPSGMGLVNSGSIYTQISADASQTHSYDDADFATYLPNW